MKKKVIIVGNGALANTLGYFIKQDARYELINFAIDRKFLKEKKLHNKNILNFEELNQLKKKIDFKLINGIGYQQNCFIRQKIQNKLSQKFEFDKYVHPQSYVSSFCKISDGAIIMSNSSIETDSKIGLGTVIWSNVVVGHGSTIGHFCWLSAGSVVGGDSIIKRNTFIGLNASISNKIIIGEKNIIGINVSIQKKTNNNSVFITKQGEKINVKSDVYAKLFLK